MTIFDFSKKTGKKERTVRHWIEQGYIPGANLDEDYIPDSARPPYTLARAKDSDTIYCSIVTASMKQFHVFPALYNICDDEFNGYIDWLVEAGYIVKRITDGITYYDATIIANKFKKTDLLKVIESIISASAEGVTTAMLKCANSELV